MVNLLEQTHSPDVVSPPLSVAEKQRFRELQLEVNRNLTGFIRCGRALLEIRNSRLYRERYATFTEFARERFALGRSQADQLCQSTQVFEALKDSGVQVPENIPELMLRPISRLPAGDLQSQAWRLASLVAPEGKVPSHTVTAKVTRMIREVTDGEQGHKRALPDREQPFTRPIVRLSKIDSFNADVCLLHVKSPEQAGRISHACEVVVKRCNEIMEQLKQRFS